MEEILWVKVTPLLDGQHVLPDCVAGCVGVASTRRFAPAQTFYRPKVCGRRGIGVTVAGWRCAVRGWPVWRPDLLYFGYDLDVLLPGRQRLLQRQFPRAVHLLFARTAAHTAAAPAVHAANAAGRRDVGGVRETPQEYAAIRARAHHKPTVRAHFHVGHNTRVPDADVRGHSLVVKPNLYHLIRTPGDDVLSWKMHKAD